ncbi:MAG: hypothetical protein IT178_03340 [Acidobacteria bacterium]|nr:hypothetical protein [Acidobacteriota bacterium]
MSVLAWFPRRTRVGLADPADAVVDTAVIDPPRYDDPLIDTSDLSVLVRAFEGGEPVAPFKPAEPPKAQITVSRGGEDDFQDRSLDVFVDDELVGRLRYDASLTVDVAPGAHRVRVFNSMFSRTLPLDVIAGQHARFVCGNGIPKGGFVLLLFLHVTFLRVHLERIADLK